MNEENRIRAIETPYKGYTFRSRLEARWAVFLDALRIPWVFEPEGYEMEDAEGGVLRYLPDFWLPNLQAFLEIKPVPPTGEEMAKAKALARASGHAVYIFYGPPTPPRAHHEPLDYQTPTVGSVICRANGTVSDTWVWMQAHRTFDDLTWNRRRYVVHLEFDDEVRIDGKTDLALTKPLLAAYAEARSKRFAGIW